MELVETALGRWNELAEARLENFEHETCFSWVSISREQKGSQFDVFFSGGDSQRYSTTLLLVQL